MKKVALPISIGILLCGGLFVANIYINTYDCLPENISVRLSLDNSTNWGDEVIGFNYENSDSFLFTPTIAVIDTGCNISSHSITQQYNAVDGTTDVFDSVNHGSVVISQLLKLVPNAIIIPIKISDSEDIDMNNLLKGLEIATSLKPDIISISIGTKINYLEIEQAIGKAAEANIVIIAAAGNLGLENLLFPARYSGVFSVLARDINNLDISLNCKSENKRSFSAPGKNILIGGEYYTGSSVAVPYVTATIAQMIAVSGKDKLTSLEIERILTQTSIYPTKYSYGLIQYDKAITAVKNTIEE